MRTIHSINFGDVSLELVEGNEGAKPDAFELGSVLVGAGPRLVFILGGGVLSRFDWSKKEFISIVILVLMSCVIEHTWIFWNWSIREPGTVENLPTFFLRAPEPNGAMLGMVVALLIVWKLYKAVATDEFIVVPGEMAAGEC